MSALMEMNTSVETSDVCVDELTLVSALLEMNTSVETSDVCVDEPTLVSALMEMNTSVETSDVCVDEPTLVSALMEMNTSVETSDVCVDEPTLVSALLEMNTSVETSDVCVDELHDDSVHETTDNHSASGNSCSDTMANAPNDTGALNQEVQTDLTCQTISELELDNRARVVESGCLKSFTIYDREMYVGAPDKVSFYTGLPNVDVLDVIFDLVQVHLTANGKLSKYQQMLLCLIRLRMNYLFKDLAYQLNISVATVQRSFHNVLDVLYQTFFLD